LQCMFDVEEVVLSTRGKAQLRSCQCPWQWRHPNHTPARTSVGHLCCGHLCHLCRQIGGAVLWNLPACDCCAGFLVWLFMGMMCYVFLTHASCLPDSCWPSCPCNTGLLTLVLLRCPSDGVIAVIQLHCCVKTRT